MTEGKGVKLLVAVGHQKVRIEFFDVQINETDPVSAINDTENAFLATYFRQSLKRHSHTRHAHDRVEDCHPDLPSMLLNALHEARDDFLSSVLHRVIVNFDAPDRGSLDKIVDCLSNGTVDAREVCDFVSGLKLQVPQDRVETSSRVRHQDCPVNVGIDEVSYLLPDLVKLLREREANELVGTSFGFLLPMAQCIPDRARVRSVGTLRPS